MFRFALAAGIAAFAITPAAFANSTKTIHIKNETSYLLAYKDKSHDSHINVDGEPPEVPAGTTKSIKIKVKESSGTGGEEHTITFNYTATGDKDGKAVSITYKKGSGTNSCSASAPSDITYSIANCGSKGSDWTYTFK